MFLQFQNYLPLEKDVALHLNKLEFLSPKDALCQVWLKLAQQFWRTKFLNFVNVFLLFHNWIELNIFYCIYKYKRIGYKGWCPAFDQSWIPFTQKCVVPCLVEIGLVVLEKNIKNVKSLWRQKQRRRSEKLTWTFSSGELIIIKLYTFSGLLMQQKQLHQKGDYHQAWGSLALSNVISWSYCKN